MNDDVSPEKQASTSVVHERRRVNPDNLALRLGPDLVRDMEALIVPGNIEMPSFAVRKVLQERYNVDRRHVYDYFHSRGLRVVKGKVGNGAETPVSRSPHRGIRLLRPQTRPRRNNKPAALPNTRRRISRGITKLKAGPRENTPINIGCSVPINTRTQQQEQSTYHRFVSLWLHHTRVSQEEEKYALHSVTNPSDGWFSATPDTCDLVYPPESHDCIFETNGHTPTLAPIQQEWNAASLYSTSINSAFLTHARPLSSPERQTTYQGFSDSLGPVCGIQECIGTYRQHMQDRFRLDYDSAYPVDKPLLPADLNRTPTLETNDFRFWRSSGEILGSEQIYLTRIKHDIQKTRMKQLEDRLNCEYPVPLIGSDQSFVQTLDDLFPTPPMDTSHVIESPVVHSGQFAVTFPFCTLPEIERKLPSEDRQIDDPFGYYASDIHGFTIITNQQNANIPFKAVETERFQSTPKSLASCANNHSVTLSNVNRGSSTSDIRRRGPFDQIDARFATFGQCKSPLHEQHGMRTRSATSRGESRRRATASAGGGL